MNLEETMAEIQSRVRIAEALERIATALEQQALAGMPVAPLTIAYPTMPAAYAPRVEPVVYSTVATTTGPASPEPPPPTNEFARSRNMPEQPVVYAPLDTWLCPIHRTRKVVPAGVSKKKLDKFGQPAKYDAFVVCDEQGCEQKPPR